MDTQLIALYGLAICTAVAGAAALYPTVVRLMERWTQPIADYQQIKVSRASQILEDIFLDVKPRWLKVAYGLGPVILGLAAFLLFGSLIVALLIAVAGIVVPDMVVRQIKAARKNKFRTQLVDVLFILSSSLKAGLSLPQAFEVVEAEMTPPASQEFGLMLKAHRLGRTFEEALQNLNERMNSEETDLITTALLVARETGGDVTTIITQLVTTIREKKKIMDKVRTLTLQGKLQAYVMSFLPVGFAGFIKVVNPTYFDPLIHHPVGHLLIGIAILLWLCGMVLLIQLSKVEI